MDVQNQARIREEMERKATLKPPPPDVFSIQHM
jgi:splicing factor 3A subunit 1